MKTLSISLKVISSTEADFYLRRKKIDEFVMFLAAVNSANLLLGWHREDSSLR